MRPVVRGLVMSALCVSMIGCALALDGYAGMPLEQDGGTVEDDAPAPDVRDGAPAPDDGAPTDAGDEQEAAPARPIVFVQAAANNTGAAGTTSFSVAYPAPVADHDTLIAALYIGSSATLMGVTDTLGNSFEVLCSQTVAAYSLTVYLVAAYDIVGGALDTVTLHMTSLTGSATTNLLLHEYANVATGADGCTHTLGNATSQDGIASPPLALSKPNEMVFAYAVSGIVAPGTGFTARSSFDGDLTEDRIVDAPGPTRALATATSGGPAWGIVAAGFKPR